jgi:hypothetical protein
MYKNGTVTAGRRAKELASFQKKALYYKGTSMAVILKSTPSLTVYLDIPTAVLLKKTT